MTSTNPLAKKFRQPALHLRLPSLGQFWPDGSLSLPATGEIPILPMTTKDEITLKTPDALMNGSGVVDVVQSCCPSITSAWDCPSVDIDAIIIAIRIASYGPSMELDAICPNCREENTYQINLQSVLEGMKVPNYSTPFLIDDLAIYLKPQKYFDLNKRNMLEFEEQQILKFFEQVTEGADPDVLQAQYNSHLTKLVDLNIEILTSSTAKIIMDGVEVTNPQFIKEYYQNAKGAVTKGVLAHIEEIAAEAATKPFDVTCSECNHQFKLNFTFDYSHFFA